MAVIRSFSLEPSAIRSAICPHRDCISRTSLTGDMLALSIALGEFSPVFWDTSSSFPVMVTASAATTRRDEGMVEWRRIGEVLQDMRAGRRGDEKAAGPVEPAPQLPGLSRVHPEEGGGNSGNENTDCGRGRTTKPRPAGTGRAAPPSFVRPRPQLVWSDGHWVTATERALPGRRTTAPRSSSALTSRCALDLLDMPMPSRMSAIDGP